MQAWHITTVKQDVAKQCVRIQEIGIAFQGLTTERLGILGIAVLVGLIAAVIPAIRASRMKVLDAIASE